MVHCGWRGSAANILGKTVARLVSEFRVDPRDLLAGIGPSLGPCHAEFVNYAVELPRALWSYNAGNAHFDFWAVSLDQLVAAGLRSENIETAGVCTVCDPAYPSYRRDKTADRFGLIAGMCQEVWI